MNAYSTSTSAHPPPSTHTRQASQNISRSPLLSPSNSSYNPTPISLTSSQQTGFHSRRGSHAPSEMSSKKKSSGEDIRVSIDHPQSLEGENESLDRDIEAFDMLLEGENGDGPRGEGGGARYEGPFQPPVGNEMVGIVASIVGVVVLAVAAMFTTVYDLVL